jgi:hypothetical protein
MAKVPATMTISGPRAGAGAVWAALGLAAFAASPASAAAPPPSEPTFALSSGTTDSAIRLRSTPGEAVRGSFRVRNLGKRRITVRLQPADIRNATNGNADYVTGRPAHAGRWLDLDAASVRLAPGASRRVAFTVRVPEGTRDASHYAGIVAVDANELASAKAPRKRAKSAGFTISRINRQALPVTIRLPGPLTRELAVRDVKLDVKPSGAALALTLRPGGSVLMQSAQVTLRVSRGRRTVLTEDTTLGQLFPRSDVVYRTAWTGRPTKGDYHVTGVIRPKDAAPVKIDRTITFTPAAVKELKRLTPPVATEPGTNTVPFWVWVASAIAAALLVGLSVAVVRLQRRASALAA